MTDKELQILNEIKKFYQKNMLMPTIRYLKDKLNFKSNYSIQVYLKTLEEKNYLKRNSQKKLILNENINLYQETKIIKVINSKSQILLTTNKKGLIGFQIKNNNFEKDGIKKEDILIIEPKKKIKDNDMGLFIIDGKYRVMKYYYKNGFYLLKDKEEIILNRVKLIGKVIMIERKL